MSPSSRASGGALIALIALCAAAQVILCAFMMVPRAARAPADLRQFTATDGPPPGSHWIQAFRSLPKVARRIPEDARTLLVSRLMTPVQYEIYFMPRPFRKLLWFPQHIIDVVVQNQPHLAPIVQLRRDLLARRRILFSQERLAEEIQWAEFLVIFDETEHDLSRLPRRVEHIATEENATLYRVVPD